MLLHTILLAGRLIGIEESGDRRRLGFPPFLFPPCRLPPCPSLPAEAKKRVTGTDRLQAGPRCSEYAPELVNLTVPWEWWTIPPCQGIEPHKYTAQHTQWYSVPGLMTHAMSKVLLLRVGIDSGCGGTLGPIFPDGTFEYVPIPESPEYVSPRSVYYRDLPARHGGTLAQYVPRRYRDAPAHYDPEFETFTYGDPTRNKRAQLLRLDDGDLLVFYAGLCQEGVRTTSRLYIIGYFTVASAESVNVTNSWPPPNSSHLLGNAHLRRNRPDDGLVVVCGHARSSRLLDRAIAISDEAQTATKEVENRIAIHGSLKRAIGRWVPSEYIVNAVDWIVGHGHPRGH